MRISDCSSDVCSSDLPFRCTPRLPPRASTRVEWCLTPFDASDLDDDSDRSVVDEVDRHVGAEPAGGHGRSQLAQPDHHRVDERLRLLRAGRGDPRRSTTLGGVAIEREQIGRHTSELQSLMRNSYAVFCLKKKKI